MAKNFNQFADGGILKTNNRVVGVDSGGGTTEMNFDFPGDGIQDEYGNYYYKYESAGALSVNYIKFLNSVTGGDVVIEAGGSDSNQSITIRSISDGGVTLSATGTGNISIDTPNSLIDMNSTTGIKGVLNDGTLSANSAQHAVTEQAIKTYVNSTSAVSSGWYFNGLIIQPTNIYFSSDGVTASCNLGRLGGGDLDLIFSTGIYTLDTTPDISVALTLGTDSSPLHNFVYIPESTKVLTVSTVGFPATEEYVSIAEIICQSAASSQVDGALHFHAWSDHVYGEYLNGHSKHINNWIRLQDATWFSGVDLTETTGASLFTIETTPGVILQLHQHPYPAFDTATGSHVYIPNDSVSAYDRVTDLTTLLTDSNGVSMANRSFNLVVWGGISEDTADCQLFINLPTESYSLDQSAIDDTNSSSVFNIPEEFRGSGFLIARVTVKNVTAGNVWSILNQEDLRGQTPLLRSVSGGGINSIVEDPNPELGGDLLSGGYQIGEWTEVTTTSQLMVSNNSYIANNAALVTLTLPALSSVGDIYKVSGKGAGLFRVAQNASQTIRWGSSSSTTGIGGYIESTAQYNTVELLCITDNTDFVVLNANGIFDII